MERVPVAAVLDSLSPARRGEWQFCLEALDSDEKKRASLVWLLENMSSSDAERIPCLQVMDEIELAHKAREVFPWAKTVDESLFRNFVLPFCVFDEERDDHRTMLFTLASSIVEGVKNVHDAAMLINQRVFDLLGVKYSTERRAPNQCCTESSQLGKASCTGLSIILVQALRAVGIPARAVGTALWAKGSGNHTWVEFHDGLDWHFTGAAEQDPGGHDRAWFVAEAAKATPNSIFAIWATSFEKRKSFFPLVWNPGSKAVFGDDVTHRYAKVGAKAEIKQFLTLEEAEIARKQIWEQRREKIKMERGREMFLDGCIKLEGKEMRFSIARVGEATQKGELLPVVISLHGGGGAPAPVNDQQWANQQQLYLNVVPNPCLYVCPRAPTNTWNLWHEAHVDLMLIRLVDNLVSMFGADSDRVYLIGYSAGGDGVFKLAPRLASLFAGACMMAGHPNGESLLSLRNLPFSIQVGSLDAAYDRNSVGREYVRQLDELQMKDGRNGYLHHSLFPNTGHWMNGLDHEAVKWMCNFRRDSRPKRVVWKQNSDVLHSVFYYLAVKRPIPNSLVVVNHVEKNVFEVETDDVPELFIYVDDEMVDFDRPVSVLFKKGREMMEIFNGMLQRCRDVIEETLNLRGDPSMMFEAKICLSFK